jgi:hypothetical protein
MITYNYYLLFCCFCFVFCFLISFLLDHFPHTDSGNGNIDWLNQIKWTTIHIYNIKGALFDISIVYNMGRGFICHVIWKMRCHSLFIIYINASFLIFVRVDLFQKPELDMVYDAVMSYYVFINVIHIFRSDQFSFLMYLCLLSSSATVNMDNGESM